LGVEATTAPVVERYPGAQRRRRAYIAQPFIKHFSSHTAFARSLSLAESAAAIPWVLSVDCPSRAHTHQRQETL